MGADGSLAKGQSVKKLKGVGVPMSQLSKGAVKGGVKADQVAGRQKRAGPPGAR